MFWRTQLEVLDIYDDVIKFWVAGIRQPIFVTLEEIPTHIDILIGKILHAKIDFYTFDIDFYSWEND